MANTQKLQELLCAVQAALNEYDMPPESLPDADQGIAEREAGLFRAISQYLAAEKVVDAVRDLITPTEPQKPHIATLAVIAQYESDFATYKSAKLRQKNLCDAAANLLTELEKQVIELMPKYVWVHYPAENIYFGVDSGSWGGFSYSLRRQSDPQKLGRLYHTSNYD